MNYWDSSALLKLYIREADSPHFLGLVSACVSALVTSDFARVEIYSALSRKELAGELAPGAADEIMDRFRQDVKIGRILTIPAGLDVYEEALRLTRIAHQSNSPIMVRSADAIHVASAVVSGAQSVVTTDIRLRNVASLAGLAPLP